MKIEQALSTYPYLLTEGSIMEALRHDTAVRLHPELEHSLLIYDKPGRDALAAIYGGFMALARITEGPVLVTSPTWRANRSRLKHAGVERDANGDAVGFLKDLRKEYADSPSQIYIGGLISCKHNSYQACEALSQEEAEAFHAWQIDRLVNAGADFLQAATLPSVSEAAGIASAMSRTNHPYFISFVIDKDGRILDGTELASAFAYIDDTTAHHPPLGYMVNCAYPSFLPINSNPEGALHRLKGFQGNASSKDYSELDGNASPQMDSMADWGNHMITLHREYGIPILGGCCGTRLEHLKYLIDHI